MVATTTFSMIRKMFIYELELGGYLKDCCCYICLYLYFVSAILQILYYIFIVSTVSLFLCDTYLISFIAPYSTENVILLFVSFEISRFLLTFLKKSEYLT